MHFSPVACPCSPGIVRPPAWKCWSIRAWRPPPAPPFAQDPLDHGTNHEAGTCRQSFQFAVLGVDAPAHRPRADSRVEGAGCFVSRLEAETRSRQGEFIASRNTADCRRDRGRANWQ